MTEKGIRGLTVTFDSFDAVVVNELKAIIQGILDNPWEGHHDYKESLKDVDSFLRVVSWYMRPSEYDEYYEALKPMYEDLVEKAYPKNPGSVPGWEYWEASFMSDLGEIKGYKVTF